MKDYIVSFFILLQSKISDVFGIDLCIPEGVKESWIEFRDEWNNSSFSERIVLIITTIFDLWLFWVIAIPIYMAIAEFSNEISIAIAKFYVKFFITFLPVILVFECIALFYTIIHISAEGKNKLIKHSFYVLLLMLIFVFDHYYHDEILAFINE